MLGSTQVEVEGRGPRVERCALPERTKGCESDEKLNTNEPAVPFGPIGSITVNGVRYEPRPVLLSSAAGVSPASSPNMTGTGGLPPRYEPIAAPRSLSSVRATANMKAWPIVELNVNGILNWPTDADGWTDRAVTMAHLHLGRHAEKIENFTGVMTRMLRQQRKAELLAKVAFKYLDAGWRVVMRGHSNGCDIIRRAAMGMAANTRAARIECAHLIAPAVDADFNRNGFNELLGNGTIKRLVICGSRNDGALKAARITSPLLNLLGNGYGTLGLGGPENVFPAVRARVFTHWNDEFGHSDWLTKDRLLETMRLGV